MALILRVDIDKPYGHHSLINKVFSKLKEDYYFPAIESLGYLKPTESFLNFCNSYSIPAILYFRNCTVPSEKINHIINAGNYQLGFHAENTLNIDTFKQELAAFEQKLGKKVNTFTKHGSGKLKLGKHHYAPFEPEKYKVWANELNLNYSMGNGITNNLEDLFAKNNFFENMFWLEHPYRKEPLTNIKDIVVAAQTRNICLVIHPANFYTFKEVRDDLEKMILLSKELNVKWLREITQENNA